MKSPQPSLYDRIDGDSAVRQLVDRLQTRVLQDSELEPFFRESSLPRVLAMQSEFFAAPLDGPVKYSGFDLARIHHGRGIKREHIARSLAHLTDALATVPEIEAHQTTEIVSRIATYSVDVPSSTPITSTEAKIDPTGRCSSGQSVAKSRPID